VRFYPWLRSSPTLGSRRATRAATGETESIREHYPDLPPENIYADVGSGDDPTRDEYVELRDRVEEGDAGKVVAAKLDRLGRSTAEVADFVDTCSDRGVGLHLVQQGFNVDPDDEMGQMMLKFMSMVAEMELKLNRERRQEGSSVRSTAACSSGGRPTA